MIQCFNAHNQVLGALRDVRSGLPATLLRRKKGSDFIEKVDKIYKNNAATVSNNDYSAPPRFQGAGGDTLALEAGFSYDDGSSDALISNKIGTWTGLPVAKRDATAQFLLAAATTNLFTISSLKKKKLQIFKHLYCYLCNNDAPPWQLHMPLRDVGDWLADLPEEKTRLPVGYFGPSGVIPSTSITYSKQSGDTIHVGFSVYDDRNTLTFFPPNATEIKRIKNVCHDNLQQFLSYVDIDLPLQETTSAINNFMMAEIPAQLVKLALDKIFSSEGESWYALREEDLFRRRIIAKEDINQQKVTDGAESSFRKTGDEIPLSSAIFLFLDKIATEPAHNMAFSPRLGEQNTGVLNLSVSHDASASSRLTVRFGGVLEYAIARYITRMLNCHLMHGTCVRQEFRHKGRCWTSYYGRDEIAVMHNALPTDECVKCNKSRDQKYFGEPIGSACCSLAYQNNESASKHTLYSTTGISSWQQDNLSVPDPKEGPDKKKLLFFDTAFTKIASDEFDASALLDDAGLAYRITEDAIVGGVGFPTTFGLSGAVSATENSINGIPYILPGLEIAKRVEKWGEGEQKLFVLLASLLQARGLHHWYTKLVDQVLLRAHIAPTIADGVYTVPAVPDDASPAVINALNARVQRDITSPTASFKSFVLPPTFVSPVFKEENAKPKSSDPVSYVVFDLNQANPTAESITVEDEEQFTPCSYSVDVSGPISYSKLDIQMRSEILISPLPEDAVAHIKKALKLIRHIEIDDSDKGVYKLLECVKDPFTAEEVEKLGWAYYHHKSLGLGDLMKSEHPEELSWLVGEMAPSAKIAPWYASIRDAATPDNFATVAIFSFAGGLVDWKTLRDSLVHNLNRLRVLSDLEIRTILASYNDPDGDPPPMRESALWWIVPTVSQTIGEVLSTKSILDEQCK